MDATVIDAYVRGRLAGANHYHALQRNPATARPENPYPSSYLAMIEWDRGFNDGYAQGQRAPRPHQAKDSAQRRAA